MAAGSRAAAGRTVAAVRRRGGAWRDELGRYAERPEKQVPRKPVPKKPAPRKLAPKKPAPRKPVPKKPAPRKLAPKKPAPRKPVPKKPAPRKPVPKKPAPRKPVPKKPAPRKPVPKKPAPRKPVPKKPAPRKPVPKKPAPRKPVSKKPAPRKPVPKKPAPRKLVPKKRRRRRRLPLPPVGERQAAAEAEMTSKLVEVAGLVTALEPSLTSAVKTFTNTDGTVDGELRLDQLPPEMRSEEGLPGIASMLSEALRAFRPFAAEPPMGGKFWASFGLRFGPQNEMEVDQLAEMYKRFKGLFQTGTYPTPAWVASQLQLGIAPGLLTIMKGVAEKQGVPPSVILVRFIWTPDGKRPGHWEGEGGGGR